MLPQTSAVRPPAFTISPVIAVVVLLPLLPVMATTGPSRNGKASSTSAITGTPHRRASSSSGRSSGTPGETTTRSTPGRELAEGAAGEERDALLEIAAVHRLVVHRLHGDALRQQQAHRGAAGEPQAVYQRLLQAPARGRIPGSVHRSFSVDKDSSANRIDRIQKRTMTLGSAQPESSK